MAENKLEFIIKKDSTKSDVELTAMSIEAAGAFSVLFNSMVKIVQLNANSKDVKIKIQSGSAVIVAEGSAEQIAHIHQDFRDIIEFKSNKKELVNEWRSIQKLFVANGLEYEANIYSNSVKTPVLHYLKEAKKLRARPVSNPFTSTIKFMSGKLIAVGGSNPNIHLEDDSSKRFTINCTEQSAKKANRFLYEKILISCWVRSGKDDERLELCDSYWHERDYLNLHLFVNEFSKIHDEILQLKTLHYKCRELLDDNNYGLFRKFLRLFIHESTDVNVLKTLLIVTQSFKEYDTLKELRKQMKDIFDRKIADYRRTKSKIK